MLKKISSYQLKHHPPRFLKATTTQRSSFYQLPALPFFLIRTFLLCKVHVFVIISFFHRSLKLVSYNHFKRPKTILIARQDVELNKRTFFLIFQWLEHDICPCSSGSWRYHWGWHWSKMEVCVLEGYSL